VTRGASVVLATCGLGVFMAGIDVTTVNVALPSIQRALHASVSGLQWTVDAYTLVIACLLMLSGSLADRFGRRRGFQIGLAAFSLGSLLCSLAPSLGWLTAFRGLQAVGGSMQGKTKQTDGSPLAMLKMLRHAHSHRALRHMIANGGAKQPKVPEVIPFDDGDELDVPGRLRVIHTPGHTEGHCVLYAPSEDALFVGDAINNLDIVTGQPGARVAPQVANASTNQAYESLSKIEELDAQTLYFGHGDPSTQGTRAIVAEARANR
jgi:Major Facilitator Superfamily/Metallo-beta-lactamase superfamily